MKGGFRGRKTNWGGEGTGVVTVTQVRNNEALSYGSDLSIKTEMHYGLSIDGNVEAWGRQS